MSDWAELTREIERLLHLRTYPVAYKRLEKVEELDKIPRVRRFDSGIAVRNNYCVLPTLVRRGGLTIGVTRDDLRERCARIHGLAPTTEEMKEREAVSFGTYSWFATVEEARKQQADYPLVPPGEAIVLAPLASGKFDPDVILIYGNPAQMMMLMCGLHSLKTTSLFTFPSSVKGLVLTDYLSVTPAASLP